MVFAIRQSILREFSWRLKNIWKELQSSIDKVLNKDLTLSQKLEEEPVFFDPAIQIVPELFDPAI